MLHPLSLNLCAQLKLLYLTHCVGYHRVSSLSLSFLHILQSPIFIKANTISNIEQFVLKVALHRTITALHRTTIKNL
jgi:hypothetical protein